MIQIVVYLQSLLRQVLFYTHWMGGSKYPTILYCTYINTDANLLVRLPVSWSSSLLFFRSLRAQNKKAYTNIQFAFLLNYKLLKLLYIKLYQRYKLFAFENYYRLKTLIIIKHFWWSRLRTSTW